MYTLHFKVTTNIRPNKLHKNLVVHFSGDAGADAGVFEDALNEADNRLLFS